VIDAGGVAGAGMAARAARSQSNLTEGSQSPRRMIAIVRASRVHLPGAIAVRRGNGWTTGDLTELILGVGVWDESGWHELSRMASRRNIRAFP
jgi:hypothetical protein